MVEDIKWCRSKREEDDFRPFEADGKEFFWNEDETKSDAKKKKNRGDWKIGYRGQSVRYKSWWKWRWERSMRHAGFAKRQKWEKRK